MRHRTAGTLLACWLVLGTAQWAHAESPKAEHQWRTWEEIEGRTDVAGAQLSGCRYGAMLQKKITVGTGGEQEARRSVRSAALDCVCLQTQHALQKIDEIKVTAFASLTGSGCPISQEEAGREVRGEFLRGRISTRPKWLPGGLVTQINVSCLRPETPQTPWLYDVQYTNVVPYDGGKGFELAWGGSFGTTPNRQGTDTLKDAVRDAARGAVTAWLEQAEEAKAGTLCRGGGSVSN